MESLLENIDIEISYDSRMYGIKHDISIVRCAYPFAAHGLFLGRALTGDDYSGSMLTE